MRAAPRVAARHPRQRAAFAVVVISGTLVLVDFTKIGLGVPFIEADLGAGRITLLVVLSGFLLAFALALLPAGRLGDTWSHKAMFLLGLGGTTIGSALCAMAPQVGVLNAGRIVMGVSAGVVIAQVMGFIQITYSGVQRGRALGIYSAAIGVASALAPALGGALMSLAGSDGSWRVLFWMNVPPGLMLIPLSLWLLPGRAVVGSKERLDLAGLALVAATAFTLILPFVLTTGEASDSPRRWLWLLVSAATAVLFVRWESRLGRAGGSPILDMELVQMPGFAAGLLVGAGYFAAFQTVTLLLILHVQDLGHPPHVAGLITVAFTLGSATSALRSGTLLQRFGARLVTLSLAGALTGALLLIVVDAVLPTSKVLFGMIPLLLGMGLCGGLVIAPNQTLILRNVPAGRSALIGSVVQLFQRVGSSIGIAITTTLYFLATDTPQAKGPSTTHLGFRHGMLSVAGYFVVALVCSLLGRKSNNTNE